MYKSFIGGPEGKNAGTERQDGTVKSGIGCRSKPSSEEGRGKYARKASNCRKL